MALDTQNSNELIPTQVASLLVQPLEQASTFLAAGPKIIDSAGPIRIPRLGDAMVPSFVGELEQIPESEQSFDEIALMPSSMTSVKVLVKYSNELARQSVVQLDTVLKDRLVGDVAAAYDRQLFGDAGDGITTPKGLFAHAGTQTLAVDGALTTDDLIDAQGLMLSAHANVDSAKFVIRPEQFVALRKLKDSSGRYLIEPDVKRGAGYALLGTSVIVTSNLPVNSAALVDFSQVVVVRDVNPTVTVLDQTFGAYDAVAIRVVSRLDAGLLRPQGVVKLTGIAA